MNRRKLGIRWYRSIGTQLLLGTALLVVFVVGFVLWRWATSAEELITEQTKEEGRAVATSLGFGLVPFVEAENWNQARVGADLMLQHNKDFVYVLVTDERSPQIALALPADQEQRFVTDLVKLDVTRAATKEGDTRYADTFLLRDITVGDRVVAKKGERIIEVAQDLRLSTNRFGVVRIGVSMKHAQETLDATLRVALFGAGICLLVALVLAYLLARSITRPVIGLAQLMTRVGDGDIESEAPVKGKSEVAALARSFNEMIGGLRQKRALEKFVPKGARREIGSDSSGKIALGGHRRRVAILFSDLRGFTSLSERLPPQEVVAMLNEYLEGMTRCIGDNGGDINEYIGDAILAVFHCEEGERGALEAVRAAWDMQQALAALKTRTKNEEVKKLVMGIGIHVGEVVEGNIGSFDRVKYGVVGDTVNLAARIQDRSRDGKFTCIFVSEEVQRDLEGEFHAVSLGEIAFKGKTKPVPVWEITEPASPSQRTVT